MKTGIGLIEIPNAKSRVAIRFVDGIARCDDCKEIIAKQIGPNEIHTTQSLFAVPSTDGVGAICWKCKLIRATKEED